MEQDVLDKLVARYKRRILSYHEPRYFAAHDRAYYLGHFLGKIVAFADEISECAFKRTIIDRYKEGQLVQKTLPEILLEIEKRRVELKQLDWAAHEYGYGIVKDAEPVSDLAGEEGKHPVIRYITQCRCAEFFLKMSGQLQKAQKRGALALKEERAIFERAKKGILKNGQEEVQPVIGFKLEGKGVAMRIELLHGELLKERFIDSKTTLEQFSAAFSGMPVDHPVVWRAAQTQLIYLLGAMVNYKLLIAPEGIAYGSWLYPRLIASFLNSKGQPFHTKQLTQTLHDIEKKERQPAHRDFLEKLVMRVAGMNWKDAVGADDSQ